jgi:hypothetical protein
MARKAVRRAPACRRSASRSASKTNTLPDEHLPPPGQRSYAPVEVVGIAEDRKTLLFRTSNGRHGVALFVQPDTRRMIRTPTRQNIRVTRYDMTRSGK